MAEIRIPRLEQGQTKIRNVPIAVTPEGFWCCPSPNVFQKTLKSQNPPTKPKPSSHPTQIPKKQNPLNEKRPVSITTSSRTNPITDDQQQTHNPDVQVLNNPSMPNEKAQSRPKPENAPKKVTVEFGEPGTSDLKVILLGKQGFAVKLSVHRNVLVEYSSFFANRISEQQPVFPCIEIDNCEDVEIYVETIGLMYCKELKQRLMKQSVSRVLRILKVGEQLGFSTCIQSCLEHLEAVPWVGDDEEEKVVSSVLSLEGEGVSVKPVLKRVSSDTSKPPRDTLSHILELVLKSKEEKGRREMKSIVLKLLRENNTLPSSSNSSDLCNGTLYVSCRASLDSLLSLFKQAVEPNFADETIDVKEPVLKAIALESDNLLWLLDILADRQAADEFASIWADQGDLVILHARLAVVSRFHVSVISSRVFVGIGRGEILPSKDTRHSLLRTWLQPLIDDYRWLQHGCRPFDRTAVEEGIGRTILTLPLEDQRTILLTWLGIFLKTGDNNCPNLQRAFEVWWRRTFVRPYVESSGDSVTTV
ncbi:BTB/POZ domain-containing protein at3g50780 [Phtheirospermum japonicum]|uniref:BTB/POZ domain-containing protein at3g50780 n=1 Tax=Phtheirospermum japonicum TaxID=374723 RepID=A0A830D0H7_9LAMI|nr:BTB/POZ domain-containing protein at3g50780 [Phtheirospermum japonicum]